MEHTTNDSNPNATILINNSAPQNIQNSGFTNNKPPHNSNNSGHNHLFPKIREKRSNSISLETPAMFGKETLQERAPFVEDNIRRPRSLSWLFYRRKKKTSFMDLELSPTHLDKEENIWFDNSKGTRTIVAATLSELFQLFITKEEHELLEIILFSHSAFIDSKDIFQLFIEYFHKEGVDPEEKSLFQRGVSKCILFWGKNFPMDFTDNSELRNMAFGFVKENCPKSDLSNHAKRLRNFKRNIKKERKKIPILPPERFNVPPSNIKSLDELTPSQIAEQITLIELKFIQRIRRREFFKNAWLDEKKEELAPNLINFLNWTQQTINWVATEILYEKKIHKRAKRIGVFIRAIKEFIRLNNFHGAMEFLSGIQLPSLAELRHTWVQMDDKTMQDFLDVEKLLNPLKNTRCFKDILQRFKLFDQSKIIPFIGAILVKMNYLHSTKVDFYGNRLVNVKKARKLFFYTNFCVSLPKKSFEIEEDLMVQYFLLNRPILPDAEQKNLAILLEEGSINSKFTFDDNLIRKTVTGSVSSISIQDGEMHQTDWNIILQKASTQTYVENQFILKQGEYNSSLYKIKKGKVKVVQDLNLKNQKVSSNVLNILEEGEIFGEMSILGLGVTTASILALEETTIYIIDIRDLLNIFDSNYYLATKFFKNLGIKLTKRIRLVNSQHHSEVKHIHQSDSLKNQKKTVKEFRCFLGRKKGILQIFPSHFTFSFTFFGYKLRERIRLSEICAIKPKLLQNQISVITKNKTFHFKQMGSDCETCYDILKSTWNHEKQVNNMRSSFFDPSNNISNESIEDSYSLTVRDWNFIRKGAHFIHFSPDEVIIKRGDNSQKLYFVNSGSANVILAPTTIGDSPHLLFQLNELDTFGEISFLDGLPSSITVVAGKEGADISVIDGSFMNILFLIEPQIAGKFYKYVATLVATYLKDSQNTYFEQFVNIGGIPISSVLCPDKVYPKTKSGLLEKRGSRVSSRYKTRYCIIQGGLFLIFKTQKQFNANKNPMKIVSLTSCSIVIISSTQFKLVFSKYTQIYNAGSPSQLEEWVGCIQFWMSLKRFNSFAPVRIEIETCFLIDGENAFKEIHNSILYAKESVFIAAWFLIPEIYLIRTPEGGLNNRLDKLLLKKAQEGVKVYILLWNETSLAVPLNSSATKRKLESLHENIKVMKHPPREPLNWSHHQKIVVVDQEVAFIGGLDICYGRWDTQSHICIDENHMNLRWPGKDYINPNRTPYLVHTDKPFVDNIDRSLVARMCWHDIQQKITGLAARDVAYNFIQRWNHHRDFTNGDYPYIWLITTPPSTETKGTGTCQILRQISEWSGSNGEVETSILQAYINLIQQAEHYIYIENQFFISSLAGNGIENEVAFQLLERIRRAIREKEVFRVFILIPCIPDGVYQENAGARFVMKWQYDTICRGGSSILEQLQKDFPYVALSDYISFYSLRSYGILGEKLVSEQIYVHSKTMIVDDKRVIIGSANINDRSLRGDRDSEIAVLTEDTALVTSVMNGKPFQASKFALELRLNLMKEHLGLHSDDSIRDPIAYETYYLWHRTAEKNTDLFEKVFPDIPSNKIRSLSKSTSDLHPISFTEGLALLKQTQGHLVYFPFHFLKNESLRPDFTSVKVKAVDRSIFQ